MCQPARRSLCQPARPHVDRWYVSTGPGARFSDAQKIGLAIFVDIQKLFFTSVDIPSRARTDVPPVDVRPSWQAQQTPSWLAQQTLSWLAQQTPSLGTADAELAGIANPETVKKVLGI